MKSMQTAGKPHMQSVWLPKLVNGSVDRLIPQKYLDN